MHCSIVAAFPFLGQDIDVELGNQGSSSSQNGSLALRDVTTSSLLVIIHVKTGTFAKSFQFECSLPTPGFLILSLTERLVTVGRWAKGMSADHEDILDVPKPQKPKTKTPKVVHF